MIKRHNVLGVSTAKLAIVAVAILTSAAAWAQYYIPGPSIPLPRPPNPMVASHLNRQWIAQNQTLDRTGPNGWTPEERVGIARIRAGRASLLFAESPGFSITNHLLSMVPAGRQSDGLRSLIRTQAAPMRNYYQQSMRIARSNPRNVVDVIAYAFRIAFRIEAGQSAPESYVSTNGQTIRRGLLNSASFQGLADLKRQALAEEIGVRAAYAEAQAGVQGAAAQSAAHEQAQVILISIYGSMPSRQFLQAVANGTQR